VVFVEGLVLACFALSCSVFLATHAFEVLYAGIGFAIGLALGIAMALWQLRLLGRGTEGKPTLARRAAIYGAIAALVAVMIYAFILGLAAVDLLISVLTPCIVAVFAARVALYLSWENRRRCNILFGDEYVRTIHAVPKFEEQ